MGTPRIIIKNSTDFKKTILIVGVFHGDEPQGEFFIEEYLGQREECSCNGDCNGLTSVNDIKNRLVFVPRLNFASTRKNPNGVDLNRNFPTKNWELVSKADEYFGGHEPASEAETRFMVEVIEKYNPEAIISIHAPYKIINFDPDTPAARALAKRIGEILEYPLQADIGYPTPGSFGTYCGIERNIPTITVEIDEEVSPSSLLPKFFKLFKYLENDY